jgi:ABC-type histidine transport system ATPase subunit
MRRLCVFAGSASGGRPDYAAAARALAAELGLLLFAEAPAALLDAVAAWRPPALARAWLTSSQT